MLDTLDDLLVIQLENLYMSEFGLRQLGEDWPRRLAATA